MMSLKGKLKLLSNSQLIEEISQISRGCDNKVNESGDCWYISTQGNRRYCSNCTRQLKIAKQVLSEKQIVGGK